MSANITMKLKCNVVQSHKKDMVSNARNVKS